jgi:hypothetical protein
VGLQKNSLPKRLKHFIGQIVTVKFCGKKDVEPMQMTGHGTDACLRYTYHNILGIIENLKALRRDNMRLKKQRVN